MDILRLLKRQKRKPPHKGEKTVATVAQTSTTGQPVSPELLLLLIRPSLAEIFNNPSDDNEPINADAIMTSLGMYPAIGIRKNSLKIIPVLAIDESGVLCYAMPMRLDLELLLQQLAANVRPPIEYSLRLFENRDVIMVSKGLYNVLLLHNDPIKAEAAMLHEGSQDFPASRIIYTHITTDELIMANLRRLEATAKYLLDSATNDSNTLPTLPADLAEELLHNFLKPIFKRAKETKQ